MPSPMATPLVPAMSAAPGFDQAVKTGWRYYQDMPIVLRPMPRAQIQDGA